MFISSRSIGVGIVVVAGMLQLSVALPEARGQELTIRQIQYTTSPDGDSDYDGNWVDCAGGIVVAKYGGYSPRLILQDPNEPDGWGAIQVKDWMSPFEMFEAAQVGDWISFTDIIVEDYRGTTFLQRQSHASHNPEYAIVSQGNPLPPPIIISVSDIPAPVYNAGDDSWFVENHDPEYLESMRVIIRDVAVTARGLGKESDNYDLENPQGDNCWASDYMNNDASPLTYHPFVTVGQHFCAVAGIFEQYTKIPYGWDYYQLLTSATRDLAICGDGDSGGDVDLDDFPRFAQCLTGPLCVGSGQSCNPPAWTLPPYDLYIQDCLMMDLDYNGDIDLNDFAVFQQIFTE